RASKASSDSVMSISTRRARAASARPLRASALAIRTPPSCCARNAATTSWAMPPQPIRPTEIIASLRKPQAGELPLRQLLHRIAHALAAEAARADAAERIGVEPEATGVVDPQRPDPQLARHLERGFQAPGEAGALQAELRRIGERQRRVYIGDALHDNHR